MNNAEEIRFIEMFAGIGGGRLGLEQANNPEYAHFSEESQQKERTQRRKWSINERETLLCSGNKSSFSCVWANEKDKYAAAIYRKNFGKKEIVECDIRTVKTKDIPEADMLIGGFPCQTFSIAGKRKGFQETRGTLFFEIARVAEAKRPKILLLENVKGLLSAQEGYCFFRILEVLDELGYDCEWQVLNSKYFGVPQNRERVFIIGHLRGECSEKIFPITENGQNVTKEYGKGDVCPTITSRYYKQGHSDPYIMRELVQVGNVDTKGHNSLWGRVYSPEGIAPNLNAKGGGLGAKTGLIVQPILTPERIEKRQNGRRFKGNGEPMFTLTGQDKHGVLLNNSKIRRLTPMECERLQGFPDGWTDGISDTQRYKCLGNAFTANVIRFLGQQLIKCFSGKET